MGSHLQQLKAFYRIHRSKLITTSLILLALFLRVLVLDIASGDYNQFLSAWLIQINEGGGFASLGTPIGDYSPPYMFILTIISYFPTPGAIAPYVRPIKYVSILFDLLLALAIYCLILTILNRDVRRYRAARLGAILVLFLPSVYLNSALWGQNDAIYATFIISSLNFFLKQKYGWGMVFYAVAFSFKLQSIFILPLIGVIYLFNHPKLLWHFLYIPLVYLTLALPSLIAGRDLLEVLTIYARQTNQYPAMTLFMPNLYMWFPNRYDDYKYFAIGLFTSLIMAALLYITIRKIKISRDYIIDIALWCLLMANFFLPAMHERYLYVADSLSIAYFIIKKRHAYVPLLINMISLFAYLPFAFGMVSVPLEHVAFIYLSVLLVYSYQLNAELIKNQTKPLILA